MNDTYWQLWVERIPSHWSVYNSGIPLISIQFQDALSIKIVKITKVNFEFQEQDYTRYIKVFQRAWRQWRRMRKRWFRHLRLRELGISYPLR